MHSPDTRIAVIGAGPTGLGAAWRLHELAHPNFTVYERTGVAGGLATSHRDERGFTWDLGPHILFSHYRYFDELAARALGDWAELRRESWIWIENRLVPYPIQNNIRHLSKEGCWQALKGLIDTRNCPPASPANFRDWIHATFGDGLARMFMLPYNEKIWAWPLEMMDHQWIGDRVSVIDLESTLRRVVLGQDDTGWGPNHRFRFPARGGIGALWKGIAALLPPQRIAYHRELLRVDREAKRLHFADGSTGEYDTLISTLPLTVLLDYCGIEALERHKSELKHCGTHVVGLGVAGPLPEQLRSVSWIYFPDPACPFYRATIFSNYAPDSVPDPAAYWSVLVEFSDSPHRPADTLRLREDAESGLRRAGILPPGAAVVADWYRHEPYGYPLPSLGRDRALDDIHRTLASFGIHSRGRFGGWKYEVSNQDHSLMQGVELVNRLLLGIPETTYWFPTVVNHSGYHTR